MGAEECMDEVWWILDGWKLMDGFVDDRMTLGRRKSVGRSMRMSPTSSFNQNSKRMRTERAMGRS